MTPAGKARVERLWAQIEAVYQDTGRTGPRLARAIADFNDEAERLHALGRPDEEIARAALAARFRPY